jgi:hypothetical protein
VVADVDGTPEDVAILLRSLNASIDRHDFYDEALFGPDAARLVSARELTPPDADADPRSIRRFNRLLLQGLLEFVRPCGADWLTRATGCLSPWLVDADPRWITRATDCVRAALSHTLIPYYTELHPGMQSQQLAIAYDAFYPHLNDADREAWRELLGRLLAMYLRTARERHWNCTTIANANSVCNGGGGMIALALLGEDPRADEALWWVRKYLWRFLDYCFGDDGGCTEGAQYFEYGGSNYLRVVRALEMVVGTDDGLIENDVVRQWSANLAVALCNDGKLHGTNDTIPAPVGQEIAWFLGTRFGDEFASAYGDHSLRIQAAMATAMPRVPYRVDPMLALLTRPDTPLAPELPALATASHLRSIEVAILRSEPRWDCAIDVGLKGSRPPYTHHNQADTGAFFLDLHGERLLIDPGYYKDEPTDHCLPIIDGIAPAVPSDLRGEITRCDSQGPWRVATVDSTAAYRGHASRVRRHLLIGGPHTAVLIDDIAASSDQPGAISSWFQAGGPTAALRPDTIRIQGDATALDVQILGPPDVATALHAERDLHDIHWGYHFAVCRWFPVTLDYTAGDVPLVVVFTDATAERPPATLDETATGHRLTIPVIGQIHIDRTADGWRVDARIG